MVRQINILNYKSALDVTLDLGRLNVFIGENGSGKTTILEAISFGSAASQNKLDNEFLSSRGLRVLEPRLMKSAFSKICEENNIYVGFKNEENKSLSYEISNSTSFPYEWSTERFGDVVTLNKKNEPMSEDDQIFIFQNILANSKKKGITIVSDSQKRKKKLNADGKTTEIHDELKVIIQKVLFERIDDKVNKFISKIGIEKFMIFAPENYFLRRFEEEGQIRPLGVRGEGLFSHLLDLSKEQPEIIQKISDHLKAIDWFEEFNIPNDLVFSEHRINIKDRYLQDNITYIDQRSSNEGFLYLLFYLTLFLSKYTPDFFSIDNIDNSLNPKLCVKVIETLNELSKENNKQVILSTHNPAILDGLDLTDDEQRLFVIYRNADGHTAVKRVNPPKRTKDVAPVRLSEAFIRGYLGGLPKNF